MNQHAIFPFAWVRPGVLGGLAVASLFLSAHPALAEIIRYQGADGRVYFTNLPPATASGTKAPAAPAPQVSPAPVVALIHRLASQHSMDPRLIQAIISVESNFNPQAISRAGAQGLMQLMPDTAARYQVEDPFNPQANIEGGIRYLKDLFRMFPGDLRHVLAAYNAGERTVQQYGGIPPYPETQRYVERVLALYGASAPQTSGGKVLYRYRTTSGGILLTDSPRIESPR